MAAVLGLRPTPRRQRFGAEAESLLPRARPAPLLVGLAALAIAVGALACAAAEPPVGYASASEPTRLQPTALEPNPESPASTTRAVPARSPRVLWRFHAGAPSAAPPAVDAAGRVAIGTTEGKLHLVAASGAFQWTHTFVGPVVGSPVFDPAGVAYAASEAGRLYAVQPDGTLKWVFKAPVSIDSGVALEGDRLFFSGRDHHLYAVSTRGGVRLRAALGATGTAPPVAADGRVVVPTSAGVVLIESFHRRRAQLGAVLESPVVGAQRIYLVADERLVALDPKAEPLWSVAAVRFVSGDERGLLALGKDRTLRWLDEAGREQWRVRLPLAPSAPATRAGDMVAVATGDGTLLLVDRGGVSARLDLADAPLERPVYDAPRNRLIVSAGEGSLAAVALK